MRKVLKKVPVGSAVSLGGLGLVGVGYARSLDLASQALADSRTTPGELSMSKGKRPAARGRVPAVVTSMTKARGIWVGLELTELLRAYYTFLADGYEVGIASP